mgnify:CR=1 FL=1
MDRIGLKRLKRKRKLNGRIKCHGDKSSCKFHHIRPKTEKKKEAKLTLWERFIKWIKTLL